MKWSYKIAEIAGIRVQIHLTFLIIVAWFALAYWQLEGTLGGALRGASFILAIFCCVLLHELGHALTARHFGIRTRSIDLLPIGGVALIERNPDSARQEIIIALAGPAVSLAIALLLWLGLLVSGKLVPLAELGVAGGFILQRLMIANLLIAVFNLVPALPMDGGRVFRALLSMRMEATTATRIAAGVAQFIAILFAALGLVYNAFLFLIAVFIWFGAVAEATTATLRRALSDVLALQAMLTDFQVLKARDTLATAVAKTLAGSQRTFPVLDGGRVVGVLTQVDLLRGLQQGGDQLEVADAMHEGSVDVLPGERMERVLNLLEGKPHGLVTVSENGQLKGIIDLDNIFELISIRKAADGHARAGKAAHG